MSTSTVAKTPILGTCVGIPAENDQAPKVCILNGHSWWHWCEWPSALTWRNTTWDILGLSLNLKTLTKKLLNRSHPPHTECWKTVARDRATNNHGNTPTRLNPQEKPRDVRNTSLSISKVNCLLENMYNEQKRWRVSNTFPQWHPYYISYFKNSLESICFLDNAHWI